MDFPGWLKELPEGHQPMHDSIYRQPIAVSKDASGQAYLNINANFKTLISGNDGVNAENLAAHIADGDKQKALEIFGHEYLKFFDPITNTNTADAIIKHHAEGAILTLPIKGMNLQDCTGLTYDEISQDWKTGDFGAYAETASHPIAEQFWKVNGELQDKWNSTYGTIKDGAIQNTLLHKSQPSLMEALEYQKNGQILFDNSAPAHEFRIQSLLEAPEELTKLNQLLDNAGVTSFSYAGNGRSGLFLKGARANGENVIIALRGHVPEREVLPHNIQPLYSQKFGSTGVEILPALDLGKVTTDELMGLDASVELYSAGGRSFKVTDSVFRNYGTSPKSGTVYYLDGDGIRSSAATSHIATDPSIHATWIREDGSWQQYKDYEELHKHFNSPLHQAGGKLETPPPKQQHSITEPTSILNATPTETASPITASEVAPAGEIKDSASFASDHAALSTSTTLTDSPSIASEITHTAEETKTVATEINAAAAEVSTVAENIAKETEAVSANAGTIEHVVEEITPAAKNLKNEASALSKLSFKDPRVAIGAVVVAGAIALGIHSYRKNHPEKKEEPKSPTKEVVGKFTARLAQEQARGTAQYRPR